MTPLNLLRRGHGTARALPLVPVAVALVLAGLPRVLDAYGQELVLRIMTASLFALSLHLLVGMTGLVSLGHAAFFGIGAYVTVRASPAHGPGEVALLLPMALLAAGVAALAIGALSLRTRGIYFLMVTLAFAQMAYFLVHDTPVGGGSDGAWLDARPVLAIAGSTLLDLARPAHLYGCTVAALAATYVLLALLSRSRFGHALAGIRANEERMRAAGHATVACKLAAFVIAGMLAGLAGFLVASRNATVNPDMLSWHESGAVLLMLILGGLGRLRGAVLGATAFVLLKEFYASQAVFGPVADHWQLPLGLTMILCVALLPEGLIGLPRSWRTWRGSPNNAGDGEAGRSATARGIPAVDVGGIPVMDADAHDLARKACAPCTVPHASPALLQATGLSRHFGGVAAVRDVSLALTPGQLHAVIGTNGAGKSTLIHLLAGGLSADAGRIVFAGQDVSCWPQPRRARAGIGRSFQRSMLFPAFSVRENCRLAAQSLRPRPWHIWQSAQACDRALRAADEALAAVGLSDMAGRIAGSLSHGQQRQLDIAMCLATRPRVLLLDEPLAGMGADEAERMLRLLETLKRDHAVLLVEHDMEAVFRVADVVTVMVDGAVIASGTPAAMRADAAVRRAYLGDMPRHAESAC